MSWLRLTGFPHPYQTYTKLHNADAIAGTGRVGSGCGKGGSLVRATTSLKPQAQLSILAKDIPQGSISTKMVFNKIGEGGGGAVFRFASE